MYVFADIKVSSSTSLILYMTTYKWNKPVQHKALFPKNHNKHE